MRVTPRPPIRRNPPTITVKLGDYLKNKMTGEQVIVTNVRGQIITLYDYINLKEFPIVKASLSRYALDSRR